jgi:hypothetical protein
LYLHSLILSLLSCLGPFQSVLHSTIFLLLSVFFFFSLQHSVSILHSSFPSILSSNFTALFLLHSSLTTYPGIFLSTPCTFLKYFSCTFSTSSCSFRPQVSAPYISMLSPMLSNIIILSLLIQSVYK